MTFIVCATKDAESKVEIRGTAYTALLLAREYEKAGHVVMIQTLDNKQFKTQEFIKSLVR